MSDLDLVTKLRPATSAQAQFTRLARTYQQIPESEHTQPLVDAYEAARDASSALAAKVACMFPTLWDEMPGLVATLESATDTLAAELAR